MYSVFTISAMRYCKARGISDNPIISGLCWPTTRDAEGTQDTHQKGLSTATSAGRGQMMQRAWHSAIATRCNAQRPCTPPAPAHRGGSAPWRRWRRARAAGTTRCERLERTLAAVAPTARAAMARRQQLARTAPRARAGHKFRMRDRRLARALVMRHGVLPACRVPPTHQSVAQQADFALLLVSSPSFSASSWLLLRQIKGRIKHTSNGCHTC